MPAITLRPIARDNWREVLTLQVAPEQQRFVSDYAPVALLGLAKAYVGALGYSWLPCGIYADAQLVGFVALAAPPSADEPHWIFHLFIDHRYQRLGYGRRALDAVLRHLRDSQPARRGVALTVHPDNAPAQSLYRRAGFLPTGTEEHGEPVYRLPF